MRISVFGGFILAFPVISYQLWRFVAPGLYRQEKKAFLPFLIASPVLFMLGCAFAFYVLLPMVYDFFLGFQQFGSAGRSTTPNQDVTIQYLGTINEYLALTMKFMVAFGLCFQLPVALTLMGLAGLVTAEGPVGLPPLRAGAMLVVAAFVTPGPDVMSQVILFAAIYPLYEISILLVRFFERKREAELQGRRASGTKTPRAAEENRERRRPRAGADRRGARAAQPAAAAGAGPRRRRRLRLGDRARPAGAGAAGGAGGDRAPGRHRPGARHAARQHPAVRARLSGQQRAALGRARHGQVEPGQGGACRGGGGGAGR